jgi:hypothetical protein
MCPICIFRIYHGASRNLAIRVASCIFLYILLLIVFEPRVYAWPVRFINFFYLLTRKNRNVRLINTKSNKNRYNKGRVYSPRVRHSSFHRTDKKGAHTCARCVGLALVAFNGTIPTPPSTPGAALPCPNPCYHLEALRPPPANHRTARGTAAILLLRAALPSSSSRSLPS